MRFSSVVIRSPNDCLAAELDAFENIVKSGGEVNPNGLRTRIKDAYFLALLNDYNGAVIGVGALKRPDENYRYSIFRKACSKEEPSEYKTELGWIFLKKEFRGQSLSTLLINELLMAGKHIPTYATVRVNNANMLAILGKFGFLQEGNAYPSDTGDYSLALYIKKA